MHYSSQGGSVVADRGNQTGWKKLNRLAAPADRWWCVINLHVTKKEGYRLERDSKEIKTSVLRYLQQYQGLCTGDRSCHGMLEQICKTDVPSILPTIVYMPE